MTVNAKLLLSNMLFKMYDIYREFTVLLLFTPVLYFYYYNLRKEKTNLYNLLLKNKIN